MELIQNQLAFIVHQHRVAVIFPVLNMISLEYTSNATCMCLRMPYMSVLAKAQLNVTKVERMI